MAGSYKHVVTKKGNLRSNEAVTNSLENGGDVFEAVEEMYGMIWWLAAGEIEQRTWKNPGDATTVKALIESAQLHYKRGLAIAKEVNAT
jgi:hypothetical protein